MSAITVMSAYSREHLVEPGEEQGRGQSLVGRGRVSSLANG